MVLRPPLSPRLWRPKPTAPETLSRSGSGLRQAHVAIRAGHGDRWHLCGETALIRIPKGRARAWAVGAGPRYPLRDKRVPAARYWPNGRLPDGVEVYQPQASSKLMAAE
jgi:hypothetical protein